MMKNFFFALLVLATISGCGAPRRAWVPQGTMAGRQAVMPQQTYRRRTSPQAGYGSRQMAYGQAQLGYGAPGMVAPPPMVMSEFRGSTYDPSTAPFTIQNELQRERALHPSPAPTPPQPSPGCSDCVTRDDLGTVMGEVDALRREVDGR